MNTCLSNARLTTCRPIRFAAGAALMVGSLAAHAIPVTWSGTTGNWFDPSQWNPTQVPTSGDIASVNNGGTANAAAGIAANSLFIGTLSGATPSATGSVVVSSGDVVTDIPVVGQTTTAGVGAVATGSLTISNGNLLPSGFFPFGVTVGQNVASDGIANGTINIANGSILLGNAASNPNLFIGMASGGATKSGSATGAVTAQAIDTSVNALRSVLIGRADNGGTANGTLSLTQGSGTLRVTDSFLVGSLSSQAGGSAIGVANLAGTQVDKVGASFGLFEIGSVDASQLVNNIGLGTANGQAAIAGGSGYTTYRVGTIIGTVVNDSVQADGVLNVGSGGLVASSTSPGSLQIGVSRGTPNNNQLIGLGGTATGTVTVTGGNVANFGNIQVGRADGFGKGIGNLEVSGGNITMGSAATFEVGSASNAQGATVGTVAPMGKGEVVLRNSTLAFQPVTPATPFASLLSVGDATNIGLSGNPSTVPVHADGKLTLDNVVVTGDPFMRVGNAFSGLTTAPTTALGVVQASGGSMALSNLLVGSGEGAIGRINVNGTQVAIADSFFVGFGSGSQGQATIANAAVTVGTNLGVGASNAPSSAPMSGKLSLQNSTMDVGGSAFIGPAYQGGAGVLELTDSTLRVHGAVMRVGQSSNNGTLFGDGAVSVERSLVDVDNLLRLDVGSSLNFAIDGLARVSEYGAFDVGTAELDGLLNIDLGLALFPLLGVVHFDLIVSSLLDGISGDFDVVNLTGLASGYAASYGVVVDQGVEIYRLSLTRGQVPEPGTLALLVLALLGMLSMQYRRDLRTVGAR
ncbi:MAG: PEP-CTERM sorting domain-containing protein [Propionivibrio sp.]|nr:PEP-CTERM sorting domain-containing protein [Propionivibrio sp.]